MLPFIARSMSASRRPGRRRQQRRGRHDLPGLAVAALRHIDLLPRDLQRMRAVRGQPFERRDRRVGGGRHRRLAGANRAAAHVHGAGAALSDAAAELRALQIQHIANDPQQGHVGGHIDRRRLSVDVQGVRHRVTRYRTETYGPRVLRALDRSASQIARAPGGVVRHNDVVRVLALVLATVLLQSPQDSATPRPRNRSTSGAKTSWRRLERADSAKP